jgi:hypothetical protein
MYNRITLVGIMADHPREMYDTDANRYICLSLQVLPPPDAPPTHWGGIYDLRAPNWTAGEDTFLVICRDPLLVKRCGTSLHKGDVVCVEGRLVLTYLRCSRDPVPLAEILASDVIVLTEHSSLSS